MLAITIPEFGDEDVLTPAQVDPPQPGEDEILIDVVASGVNRADLMQRQGLYPPPAGASEYPGLEISGRVATPGGGFEVGDPVVALLSGGGYAQQVAVPVGQVLPVPEGVGLVEAAALPEVTNTVWSNLMMVAHLQPDETLLIHGGSSGIGTMAIQIATALGVRVAVTAGSDEKLEACRALGAEILINYKTEDFVERMNEIGGANVILDVVGAKYLERNVQALAPDGRLVIIGLQGGRKGELNIGELLAKRGSVHATSLRSLSKERKAEVVAQVLENVWPLVESGKVQPIIDHTLPLAEAAQAHRDLQASDHIGKVLLVNE